MPIALSWTLGKTGGLSYHLLAMRYRRTLWQPFISKVKTWLEEWKPNSRELVVFGPSGGWTLPKEFISRFDRVIAVEPDPIARKIFASRFKHVSKIELISRHDLLPWSADPIGNVEPLRAFLKEHPHAAILFSNVLGQMPLALPARARSTHSLCSKNLMSVLQDREWASYHDIVSVEGGRIQLKRDHAEVIQNIESFVLESLRVVDSILGGSLNNQELVDHESLWLSESRRTQLALWRLQPKRTHVIGFVKSDF